MVSTNRVYQLTLDDGSTAIAKVSNYGSFFLFAEDHDRLHRCHALLQGGRFEHFLADSLTTAAGRPYIWYDGEMWAVMYNEVPVRDRLPRVLTDGPDRQPGRRGGGVPPGVRRDRAARCRRRRRRSSRMRSTCSTWCPNVTPRPGSGSTRAGSTSCAATPTASWSPCSRVATTTGSGSPCSSTGTSATSPSSTTSRDKPNGRPLLAVQPVGLRLVPHRVAAARLLLPVAGVVAHRRQDPLHVRRPHPARTPVPAVPAHLPPDVPAAAMTRCCS